MVSGEARLPSMRMNHVLLVEGPDDKHVVEHIYRRRFGSEPPFTVMDKDGFSPLCDAIGPIVKAPGRLTVGVIVDANDNFQARWTAVTDRLRRARPSIMVGDPMTGGTVIDGGSAPRGTSDDRSTSPGIMSDERSPRVGIWLWPDNRSPGELEDFVSRMIPDDDSVWPISECYINGIPTEHRKFADGKTMRAKVHAWLATRREPRRMGTAIRTGDLEIEGALATEFLSWIQQLFGNGG